jgi:hypothetical protein
MQYRHSGLDPLSSILIFHGGKLSQMNFNILN